MHIVRMVPIIFLCELKTIDIFIENMNPELRFEDLEDLNIHPTRGHSPLTNFLQRGRAPKHEYYQGTIIRTLKKAIHRSFRDRKLPSGGFFKSLIMTPEAIQKGETFKEVVLGYPALEDSATLTDRESQQPREENTKFSSFNKKYIQKFFSHQEVRTVHYYFTEWVFQASPEQLCEAMKFKCCTQATHTEACEQKWSGLKRYTQEGMIREVGWTPVLPN